VQTASSKQLLQELLRLFQDQCFVEGRKQEREEDGARLHMSKQLLKELLRMPRGIDGIGPAADSKVTFSSTG
jgi:hypothetical protein